MYRVNGQVFTVEAWDELIKLKPDLRFHAKSNVFYHAVKHEPIIDLVDVLVEGEHIWNVEKSPRDSRH